LNVDQCIVIASLCTKAQCHDGAAWCDHIRLDRVTKSIICFSYDVEEDREGGGEKAECRSFHRSVGKECSLEIIITRSVLGRIFSNKGGSVAGFHTPSRDLDAVSQNREPRGEFRVSLLVWKGSKKPLVLFVARLMESRV